jgi:dihydrofolate synthase/folylpolyglutamate synthase
MKFPSWPNPLGYRDIKLGLDRVYELLERVGNPHKLLPPVIHVAGTNGKGSTIAFLDSILTEAKYKVHRYISPHLVEFNERIILAGREIDDEFLEDLLDECRYAANQHPKIEVTFFEGITVAAFLAFSKVKADALLLETGMGGRLDATNVIEDVLLSIITPISLDHTEFLGKTIEDIAFEKAGIIKNNSQVIIGKQEKSVLEIIEKQAIKKESRIYALNHKFIAKEQVNGNGMIFQMNGNHMILPLPFLIGKHQIENAGMAIAALLIQKHFKISNKDIGNGIINAYWPARLENILSGELFNLLPSNYDLFLDGGHNEGGARIIANWINHNKIEDRKAGRKKIPYYLICGMLQDKDSKSFLKYLAGSVDFLVGIPIEGESKSKTGYQIAKIAADLGIKSVDAEGFIEAFEYIKAIHDGEKIKESIIKNIFRAKSKQKARIIICGSLYLAGQFINKNN